MAYAAPQTFNCDSCNQSILPMNPRVHCLTCSDYDLCANCALGERFTGGHLGLHQAQVFKESGGGANRHPPILSSNTNYNQSPQSQPPGFPSPHERGQPPPTPLQNGSVSSPGFSSAQVNPGSLNWQPFFFPDMSASPTYITLLNDIFTHLDPSNTGALVPETFSRFLDDMGYPPHENACTFPHLHKTYVKLLIFRFE